MLPSCLLMTDEKYQIMARSNRLSLYTVFSANGSLGGATAAAVLVLLPPAAAAARAWRGAATPREGRAAMLLPRAFGCCVGLLAGAQTPGATAAAAMVSLASCRAWSGVYKQASDRGGCCRQSEWRPAGKGGR